MCVVWLQRSGVFNLSGEIMERNCRSLQRPAKRIHYKRRILWRAGHNIQHFMTFSSRDSSCYSESKEPHHSFHSNDSLWHEGISVRNDHGKVCGLSRVTERDIMFSMSPLFSITLQCWELHRRNVTLRPLQTPNYLHEKVNHNII